ncbi:mitochondrial 2-amino-3-ketobutyrate CoA ligase (glycine C-acetyltransferase) [Andalucia godoyi]|uniref:2-amino-3-ketobutyrate coenzyme A ligase, mitochondrial n=1 Tax=Andalucia godoyi TaxID=505711 RepID=A0A8K0AHP3_ANDGO|nr:mitochondrial 2-amino-3-ketobutyrate CoA ligase (glycine C-acetyltransferase) [Andalucia godoyi]|eukprot:ANDGO_08605.mRNA.1 mitochondrial 2-amino-3-ketobutyrate CoA ligase (glycine C-acetyltransferase)
MAMLFGRRSVHLLVQPLRNLNLRTMSSSSSSAASAAAKPSLESVVHSELASIQSAGTYKKERVITSAQQAQIGVSTGSQVLNFCANNYLGLANHPEVIKAAHETLDSHGFGLSSVRFICGTQDIHKQLEQRIAQFHKKEDAILFPSCFDANAGIFEALLTDQDAIISDELNHASIIDGIRLCKAKRFRYKSKDMKDLEEKLKESQDARIRLIATDGAFSMEGSVAPLDEICRLADKYDAKVFVDECHATGFFGSTGRGTPELFGVEDRVDIINSTLGKALGGATGGYTAAKKEIVDILRQRARPYLFSNSIAPPVVGASLKVFDLLSTTSELRDRLNENTKIFRSRMKAAGFRILGNDLHPIAPVWLGDARLASEFSDDMLQRGIYVIGFSFPVVPKGEARIRVQLSAAHSAEQVNKCVDAFIEIGRKRGVIA